MAKSKIKLEKIYRVFLYAMPVVLFFSYWPLINFGHRSSINLDLSLPIIWLVLFDILAFALIIKKKLFKQIFKNWLFLLLPLFLTISLFWTPDLVRGILNIGVLWLVYFAIFSFFSLKKEIIGEKFWKIFLKTFFGTALFTCGWCLVQCIMDVAGIGQNSTLLCNGCVYKVFGFPHPNGFAAEPQFMGNLLLAPIFVSLYLFIQKKLFSRRFLGIIFFIFVATLFLTMSRGAIYSFTIAMIFFTIIRIIQTKKWRVLLVWPAILLTFLFTLNTQGLLAEVSKTDDTYISGVTKVVSQLTLGKIDLGGGQVKKNSTPVVEETPVSKEDLEESPKEEAVFDGYTEASATGRTVMWKAAFETWKKKPFTMLFGVGYAGGIVAVHESGTFDRLGEIINNEAISLLLESGIIGICLTILTLVLVFKAAWKKEHRALIFTLMLAYAVSMVFFSGIPNALHIYLLLGLFIAA